MANNGSGKICIEVDEELADKILKQSEYRENVQNNLRSFWNKNGKSIIDQYKDQLRAPEHHNINENVFKQKLRECQVIVMSANTVEGSIITRRLMEVSDVDGLDAFPFEGHLFQFARVEGVPICHIWPSDTSSFTRYGSFSALEAALEIATPQYVLSVGVAFGVDPIKQSLGDVLISKDLIFYDHFNKVTNGQIKLNPHETYRLEGNLTAQLHPIENPTPPKDVGSFGWFYGTMLTGGTVLSDAEERNKLLDAASRIGHIIIGGEMEASGIYYACQMRKNRNIPFIVIKGICDWGAEKNAWEEVIDGHINGDAVKDCVQAFACDNAFSTMRYILKNLNFNHATMMTEDSSEGLVNRNRVQERTDNANKGLIFKNEKTRADSSIDQISSVDGRYCRVYEMRENEYQADERSGSSFAIHKVYGDWITIHINYGDGEANTIMDFRVGNQKIVGKHKDYVLTLHSIEAYSKCKVEIRKKDW